MTAPVPAIPDAAAVKAYLRLDGGDVADDTALTLVVDAVNALMVEWKGAHPDWPANWAQGAVMLAARVYRRRNSPSGVESFGELGPLYVQRNDPDIAQLLGMGAYTRPAVG